MEISDVIRREFGAKDDERDRGIEVFQNIRRFCDIQYGPDPEWNVLDVYRPYDKDGQTLPVIVSVHGGAWVYGDKERYQFYCMDLSQNGFAVINYTYRLAPENKWPAPFEDTNFVMQWLKENADRYQLDLNRVFAVGDSAGAHLLSLYTSIMCDPEYARFYNFTPPEGVKFSALALNCGYYNVDLSPEKIEQTRPLVDAFLPEHGSEHEQWLMTPCYHVTENYPPVLLTTAENDFLKLSAPYMLGALLKADIPVEFRYYQSEEKKLGHVFMLNMHLEEAHACNREACDYFRRYF